MMNKMSHDPAEDEEMEIRTEADTAENGSTEETKLDGSDEDVEGAAKNRLSLFGRLANSSPDPTAKSGDMDADDYHNSAVNLSRRGDFAGALELCDKGLEHFPASIDLMADAIK